MAAKERIGAERQQAKKSDADDDKLKNIKDFVDGPWRLTQKIRHPVLQFLDSIMLSFTLYLSAEIRIFMYKPRCVARMNWEVALLTWAERHRLDLSGSRLRCAACRTNLIRCQTAR